MNALKVEEDRLDREQENTHGEYLEMKAVFENLKRRYNYTNGI